MLTIVLLQKKFIVICISSGGSRGGSGYENKIIWSH